MSAVQNLRDRSKLFLHQLPNVVLLDERRKVKNGVELRDKCLRIGVISKLSLQHLAPEGLFWELFDQFNRAYRPNQVPLLPPLIQPVTIPKEIEGVPTDIVQVGIIKIPLPTDPTLPIFTPPSEHQKRWRDPIWNGGDSYIVAGSSACTKHGYALCDPSKGGWHQNHQPVINDKFGLHLATNWHCSALGFAQGNPYSAPPGTPFLQPSPYDGGVEGNDDIGYMENFVIPVKPMPTVNKFDLALQRVRFPDQYTRRVMDFEEVPERWLQADIQKLLDEQGSIPNWTSSRSNGDTYGQINSVTGSVNVDYAGFIAIHDPVMEHTARIIGGSSGSKPGGYVGEEKRAAGINFAGSDTISIASLYDWAEKDYGVTFDLTGSTEPEPPPPPPPPIFGIRLRVRDFSGKYMTLFQKCFENPSRFQVQKHKKHTVTVKNATVKCK